MINRNIRKENEMKLPYSIPNKFSVVLVDYNEVLIYKTIESLLTNSSDLLGEVLVIDDGSTPPVEYDHPQVRIIRNANRTGLIQARNQGGNEARGEFIAMMDAHIKVLKDWLREPYQIMKENYKTVVSPIVLGLNATTFEFEKITGVASSAGFYWDFNHKWDSGRPGTMESAITMGEFFASKRWWTEIDGMDEGMQQWGVENIDFSLRTWLCGGRIVVAPHCIIAHAFRLTFPYKINSEIIARNAIRSAEVWLDEYKDIFYETRGIKKGSIDFGDISKPLAMKKRMNCHSFKWFVETFKGISPCFKNDTKCGTYSPIQHKDIDFSKIY